MKDRIRDIVQSLGSRLRRVRWAMVAQWGGAWFALVLTAFWFSLPVDTLLEYATREAGKQGLRLQFAAAGNGLAGPWVEGLEISAPMRMSIERLVVRPRMQTLWGDAGVSFSAELGDGTIAGEAAAAFPADVHIAVDQVRLAKTGVAATLPLGMSLDGTLSGEIDGEVSPNPDEITGTIDLVLEQPRLETGALPLPVSAVTGSKLRLKAEAQAGNVEIAPLSLDGSQIWGTVRGSIQIQKPVARSRAKLTARIHFNDELGNAIGPLLPMAGFRQERDAWVRQYNGPLGQLVRSR